MNCFAKMYKMNSKKILLISPHFYPEIFKCNDVAFDLVRRGYDVTVLSDIPNYPSGKFFKGYGLFKKRKEIVNGVKVIRTAMIPRGNGSGKMLALNYISFALTASVRAFFMGIFHKYDVILVHETSPITVGIPAIIIKKLRPKTQLLFWVLDLWPESLQVAGGINNKMILDMFESIAKSCYKNSDKILMSSKGFRNSICQKGDFTSKLVYFPNWAEESLVSCRNYKLPNMPNGFKVMFAGNIGEAQDFEHTMDSMRILSERGRKDIHLILVGDGRKRQWVEEYVQNHSLQDVVHWVGRHPLETMGLFFGNADVLYFALKDSLIFNLTCPAKLQAYMSAGKPIIAMINGEGDAIVKESGCGITVPAGNAESLADAMEMMSAMDPVELEQMGQKGKSYCEAHFSFDKNMSLLEKLIN